MTEKEVLLDALRLVRQGVNDAIELIESVIEDEEFEDEVLEDEEATCTRCGLTLCECYVEAWNTSEGSAWNTEDEDTEDEFEDDECPYCGGYDYYCECDEDDVFDAGTNSNVWNAKTGIWNTEE